MDVDIVDIITQSTNLNQAGVYPLDHKYDINQIQVFPWGVKQQSPLIPAKHRGHKIVRKSDGISLSAKKRLIKMTSAMEEYGAQVSHMITFTLPRQRWEEISDEQKAMIWRTIKSKLLKALEKLLSRQSEDVAYFWFQEFQQKNGRGAPHLHVLINVGELNDTEWQNMLHSLIHIWQNSMNWDIKKDGEFPSQSVDFNRMKKRDFRYARKYSSKAKQKDAPYKANWGNWWGRGGIWKKIKLNDYSPDLNLLSENDQDKIFKVFRNNTWLTWSLLRYRDKDLHDKLQAIMLKPFDYSRVRDKHTTVGRVFFKRAITRENKKDDMLFFKNTSSSFSSSIQIIPHPLLPCQEPVQNIEKSEEKAVKSSIQLSLLTTIGEGV
jgi:hypothetical protein